MVFQFTITERQGGLIFIHKMTQEMTQIFSIYDPVCMIDQCAEEYNFWPTVIILSPTEEK